MGKFFLKTFIHKRGLTVVLIICLISLLINLGGTYRVGTGFPLHESEVEIAVEQQAWSLAEEVIALNTDARAMFVAEVVDIYNKARDRDVVIYYCEGGWGSRPLSVNPEGQSLVAGIEAKLTEMGYTYYTADYPRSRDNIRDYLYEGKELLIQYPVKSKQLAAKINFLTGQIDDLKVILVGKSTGALLVNKAAKRLENNPDIYNIQIGNPLGCQVPTPDRSLPICANGVADDAMIGLDLWSAFKTNKMKMLLLVCAPSFTPVDWLVSKMVAGIGLCNTRFALKIPGHDYMWHYPAVGPVIESFLIDKFGGA